MSIFRSSGCVVLHVVFSTRCCGCGPKEPVCSLVHCVSLYKLFIYDARSHIRQMLNIIQSDMCYDKVA
jgi:hypothetical protein